MSVSVRGRWWLVGGWAAIILVLTSIPMPQLEGPGIPNADKAAHFVMYLVLGALVARALGWELSRRSNLFIIMMTMLLVGAFGALDEWHQQFVNRTPAVADWLADLTGAGVGAAFGALVRRRRPQEETDD